MSLARGKYGVEWVPTADAPHPSGMKWILLGVALVALVSFVVTRVRLYRASFANRAEGYVAMESVPPATEVPPAVVEPPQPVAPEVAQAATERRPVRVRNLLLRLEQAEKNRDVEMAVSTIEQIRALPGLPAADLDDALARRLGVLNIRRLFTLKHPLWVARVEVRRGDSASRIAAENGSTFASFRRLNGGDVACVRLGAKVYVMNHPHFTLVVHRRSRTADLMLADKFFKRYDLLHGPTAANGSYELSRGASSFFKSHGLSFKTADQTELEILLPNGTNVLISEM